MLWEHPTGLCPVLAETAELSDLRLPVDMERIDRATTIAFERSGILQPLIVSPVRTSVPAVCLYFHVSQVWGPDQTDNHQPL
jgi:hypothetical protein